jgi:hypothetical protein
METQIAIESIKPEIDISQVSDSDILAEDVKIHDQSWGVYQRSKECS